MFVNGEGQPAERWVYRKEEQPTARTSNKRKKKGVSFEKGPQATVFNSGGTKEKNMHV